MTIKQFAALCGCNAQTLRYYDRIGLLNPEQVDPWSGYRYYAETQALDYVKIKNLQLADFSIEEIKSLLVQPEEALHEAFAQKIAQQRAKLERIVEIQQSYLREKSTMERAIQEVSDFIVGQISSYESLYEFGMKPEDGPEVVSRIRAHMQQELAKVVRHPKEMKLRVNDEITDGADNVLERLHSLELNPADDGTIIFGAGNVSKDTPHDEGFETVWERSGWTRPSEFIDEIPDLRDDGEYQLELLVGAEKCKDMTFPLLMLGVMLIRQPGADIKGCSMQDAKDGVNCFQLKRKGNP